VNISVKYVAWIQLGTAPYVRKVRSGHGQAIQYRHHCISTPADQLSPSHSEHSMLTTESHRNKLKETQDDLWTPKKKEIKTMRGVPLISQSVLSRIWIHGPIYECIFVFSATNFTVLFIVPFHSQIISNVPSALHFKLLRPVNITLFPRFPCSL
jgi:hypothetical protein